MTAVTKGYLLCSAKIDTLVRPAADHPHFPIISWNKEKEIGPTNKHNRNSTVEQLFIACSSFLPLQPQLAKPDYAVGSQYCRLVHTTPEALSVLKKE